MLWGLPRHLGSLTTATWVSFDFSVSYSSCWGYSLTITTQISPFDSHYFLFSLGQANTGRTRGFTGCGSQKPPLFTGNFFWNRSSQTSDLQSDMDIEVCFRKQDTSDFNKREGKTRRIRVTIGIWSSCWPWGNNESSSEYFSANSNLYQVPLDLFSRSLFSTALPGRITNLIQVDRAAAEGL